MIEKLQKLKASSPAYADLSDEEFAARVHARHYADQMSQEEFFVRTGLADEGPLGRSDTSVLMNNSATLGFADEIKGIGEGSGEVIRELKEKGFEGFSELVDDFKRGFGKGARTERARVKVARENLGKASLPVELVTGAGATRIASGALAKLGTFGQRFAQSLKGGLPIGVAAGAGSTEGGLSERAAGGAMGGLVATGLGAGVSAIPNVTGVVSRGANALRGKEGANASASRRLAELVEDSGMTPTDAQFNLTQAHARGAPKRIADLSTATQNATRTTRSLSDKAAIRSTQLQERAMGQIERIEGRLRRRLDLGSKEYAKSLNEITNIRSRTSAPLYDQAFDQAQDVDISPLIRGLIKTANEEVGIASQIRPIVNLLTKKVKVKNAAGKVVTQTRARTSLKELNSVKKRLDAILDRSKANPNSLDKDVQRVVTEFKNKMLMALDNSNPAYKAARDTYAGHSAMKNALEKGRDFLKGDYELLGNELKLMSSSEKQMFRLGVQRQMSENMGRSGRGTDLTRMFSKPNTERALREVFPDDQSFRAFYSDMLEEGITSQTRNIVLTGSQTADKQAGAQRFGLWRRIMNGQRGGIVQNAMNEVIDGIARTNEMIKADANLLNQMLLEPDPTVQRQILNGLHKTYGQKVVEKATKELAGQVGSLYAGAIIASTDRMAPKKVDTGPQIPEDASP